MVIIFDFTPKALADTTEGAGNTHINLNLDQDSTQPEAQLYIKKTCVSSIFFVLGALNGVRGFP